MTRIAFISEHASPVALLGGADAGGQNVYVDEVSRALAELGCEVDVFTRRDGTDLPQVVDWAPGVRVVNLPVGPARSVAKDDLWPWMPAFREEFLRFMVRDGARYGLLHGNFWMSGWVTARLRRDLGVPAVQLFHALGTTKRRYQGGADTSPAERIEIERWVAGEVDGVIATCPHECGELAEDYRVPTAKVTMIPLAVNAHLFRPMDAAEARRRVGFGLQPEDRVVVYVGRMLPRKDIRNVVRAVALLAGRERGGEPPLKLLVVGGECAEPDPTLTPEIGEVQRLAAELGIGDRVICTGMRQPGELCAYYGAGDVAVTTPWYEPFGLTPLEAMACARPVIGAAVGGITFTVQHGQTGLLVPPREPAILADALASLLDDPQRRSQLGVAARRRVETAFTWPAVARRTAELYERLRRDAKLRRAGRAPTLRLDDSLPIGPTVELGELELQAGT